MKNQKGITLVALIITIIVMLILAGVIITAAVADGGVISRAQGAKQEQKVATEIEQIKAEMAGYLVKGNGKLNMSLFGGDKKISVNGKSYDVVEDTNVNEVYEIVKNENEEYIIKIKNEKQVMEQNLLLKVC